MTGQPAAEQQLQALMDELLAALAVGRCTLRQDLPGDYAYPVTHEALAPGVHSLRDVRAVDHRTAPTVKKVLRERRIVVQNDCRAAADADPEFDNPGFRDMLGIYGGLAAFIAAPGRRSIPGGDQQMQHVEAGHVGAAV